MSAEIKVKARKLYEEGHGRGNLDVLDELVAPEYVRYQPPMKQVKGVAGYKAFIQDVRSAYTGFEINIHDILVDGDKSVTQFTLKGKHTGQAPTLQAAPTGKQIEMKVCAVCTWKSGQVVEEWAYNDYLGLLQQFGVIPLPGLFA
jgi:predicted ester cyclase